MFEVLHKKDPEITELLNRIRSGKTNSDDAARVERHLYSDTMVPGARNKAAYENHLEDYGNSGVHGAIDLTALGMINKLHTEIGGDKAIKDMGDILHRTASKYGIRLFRPGGDEFAIHALEPEHAHRFARDFEKAVDDYHKVNGPIGGTHRLGASIGLGYSREHAGRALIEAKKKLYDQDEVGHRTPKFDFKEMPSSVHSALHEEKPEGWRPAADVIKEKKKVMGNDLSEETSHPAAMPTTLKFPSTSITGDPGASIAYTSTPHAYSYSATPLNNPLSKSDIKEKILKMVKAKLGM